MTIETKNQLLKDVHAMSKQNRAALLLQSTLLRLCLDSDDPKISNILLDPDSYSKAERIQVWNLLTNILGNVQRDGKAAEEGMRRNGFNPADVIANYSEQSNACYVWLQTVGAQESIVSTDTELLWNYLREGVPYLGEAVRVLKDQHEVATKLKIESTFLFGLPVDHVIQEATRTPKLR